MSHIIDLTGKRFGRLEVIEKAECPKNYGNTYAWWLCRCDCGNLVTVIGKSLRSGTTKSCGCYRSEYWKQRLTKHDKCYTRLAQIWYSMMERCRLKNCAAYENYGGRGITVCKEWDNDFMSFYNWAMKTVMQKT